MKQATWIAVLSLVLSTTPVAAAQRIGDCNGDLAVEVNELVLGVNIALGIVPLTACPAMDCAGDEFVHVDCVIQAIDNAMAPPPCVLGCADCAFDECTDGINTPTTTCFVQLCYTQFVTPDAAPACVVYLQAHTTACRVVTP